MRIHIDCASGSADCGWCSAEFNVCPRVGEFVRVGNKLYEVVRVIHEVARNSPAEIRIRLRSI